MNVTVLWSDEAARAHGAETTWSSIASVEATPQELKLHPDNGADPVVVDRDYVVAYHRIETSSD